MNIDTENYVIRTVRDALLEGFVTPEVRIVANHLTEVLNGRTATGRNPHPSAGRGKLGAGASVHGDMPTLW